MPEYQQRKRNAARGRDEDDSFGAASSLPTSIPTSAEQVTIDAGNKIDDINALLGEETNPGRSFGYHNEDEGSNSGAVSPAALDKSEDQAGDASSPGDSALAGGAAGVLGAVGGLYAGAENPRALIRRIRWTRRKTVGAGIAGVLTGGALFGAIIASGPLEVIHMSEILMHSFDKSSSDSSVRTNSLMRYYRFAKTGDIGETRVGRAGSAIFKSTIAQLDDVGVTFERNKLTGAVDVTKIDTSKLQKNYPELKHMGAAESRAFLADRLDLTKLGISPDELKLGVSSNGGYIFTLEQTDYGVSVTKVLNKNTLSVLQGGKPITTIRASVLGKFFNEPNILHQMSRKVADQENKLATKAQRAAFEKEQEKAQTQTLEERSAAATENIKSNAGALRTAVGGGLLIAAATCAIRDTADSVVQVNHDAVVAPAALKAVRVVTTGQQTKGGQDVDPNTIAAVKESFYSAKGNVNHGTALRALGNLDGPGALTGIDISNDHKQAFSNATTAETIKKNSGADSLLAGAACSPAGKVIQVAASVALIVSGFATGGATWSAYAGAKIALGAVATGAAIVFAEHIATGIFSSSDALDIAGTPEAGNLLAYGSRAAANIAAVPGGAISLGNNNSTILTAADSTGSFRTESVFARMFNATDYRSLTGRLIDNVSPSWTQNIASMANGIANIGSAIPSLFSSLMPHAAADAKVTAGTYDWAFPQYGIPDSMLNDPELLDPYANAATVASILDNNGCRSGNSVDSSCTYAEKISTCFGDILAYSADTGWDVTPSKEVNPNSDDYSHAGCANVNNDDNWRRIVMFVFDDSTIKAVACQQGDGQSCQDLGMSSGADQNSGSTTVNSVGAPSYCADGTATSSQKIVCSAWLFNDYGYNDPGHRGDASFMRGFLVDVKDCVVNNFGNGCKYPKYTLLVDCSGLVDSAVFDATGVDMQGEATGGYPGDSHLQQIDMSTAQAGDIVWNDGHTELVVSNDPASKTLHTFGAHMVYSDASKDIGPATYNYSYFQRAYRVQP